MSAGNRIVLGVGILLALAAWFYFFDPADAEAFLPCPFHAVTGLSCPGCGTQRAVHHLLHLDAISALKANPLAVFILPLAIYVFASWFMERTGGRRLPDIRMPAWLIVLLGALVFAFWILRNLECYTGFLNRFA